jgi:hypothetical protein
MPRIFPLPELCILQRSENGESGIAGGNFCDLIKDFFCLWIASAGNSVWFGYQERADFNAQFVQMLRGSIKLGSNRRWSFSLCHGQASSSVLVLMRFFRHRNHAPMGHFTDRILELDGSVRDVKFFAQAVFYVAQNALTDRGRDVGD